MSRTLKFFCQVSQHFCLPLKVDRVLQFDLQVFNDGSNHFRIVSFHGLE